MIKNTLSSIIFLLALTSSILCQVTPTVLSVGDSLHIERVKPDSILFAADSLRTDYEKQIIKLYSNASIDYKNYKIDSDTLTVDLENRKAFTKGLTRMEDNSQLMIGHDTYYDVNTEEGILYNGIGKFEQGFYSGDEIRKVGKKIYDIDYGKFTTCEDEHPHFYMKSKKLRVYVNEQILGKPFIMYVNDFPILWLPYASFPAKKGRKAGFLVPQPGYNNSDGKYVKNVAYYYPFKDYADFIFSVDLTELRGWNFNFNNDYKKRYVYNGGVDFTYNHRVTDIGNARDDWVVNATHFHDFGNKTTLRMNLNYMTSKQIWESEEDIDKRLSERITSSISFSKPLLSSTLSLTATYTDDFLKNQKAIVLPRASYSLPSKPIYEFFTSKDSKVNRNAWWTKFNVSTSFSAIQQGTIKEENPEFSDIIWSNDKDTTDVYINEHHAGASMRSSIYYSDKLMSWLVFSQTFNYNEYVFDRSKIENNIGFAGDYSTSSKISTTIYGFKKFNNSYLKAMRHILKPSASFSYKPDLSKHAGDYYTFGPVSPNTAKRSRTVNFSLGQEWQVKIYDKVNDKEKVYNNLISMTSNCSYNLENKKKPFSEITHSIKFNPKSFSIGKLPVNYNTSVGFRQNPYDMTWLDWKATNWSYSQNLSISGETQTYDYFRNPSNPLADHKVETVDGDSELSIEDLKTISETKSWKLSFTHDMSAERQFLKPKTNNLRMSSSFNITKNWNVTYSNYIDVEDKRVMSQSINLTRDLHCWRLTLQYNKSNEYWDYTLVFFNVKLHDDLKIETKGQKKYY